MKSVLFKHRSIRKFRPTPIPEEVLRECLEAASRASTCGNMQLYSLVVTRDETLRERLAPCHFNQPMVRQAPCVVTVCADIHRFMMWCGRMIYRAENKENIDRYMQTYAGKESMTHETIHLRQAQVIGSWVKYYWRYFVEWIKGNPICHPASSAYYTIKYEMEAYANEGNPDYPVNYDGNNLSRYKIKSGRKKLYKSVGGTSKAWKTYIRTL